MSVVVGRLRKFRPAPRAIGDHDPSTTSFVSDQQNVSARRFPVIDETIGAVPAIRMNIARVLDVGSHHLATVISHQ